LQERDSLLVGYSEADLGVGVRPICQKALLSLEDAKRIVTSFIETYNHDKRLHSAVGFVTPYVGLVGRQEMIFHARDVKLNSARATRMAVRERVLMDA
jgi:hypothetical protein